MKLRQILLYLFVIGLLVQPSIVRASTETSSQIDQIAFAPLMQYIRSGYAWLDINGSAATIEARGTSNNRYISVKATLMRNTSSGWVEVDSYSSSDSGSVLVSRSFRLVTRGTYRVKAVFSCSGETLTTYSSARTY